MGVHVKGGPAGGTAGPGQAHESTDPEGLISLSQGFYLPGEYPRAGA